MKLGTETGSLTNHIYSRMLKGAPYPEVGMGVTVLGWTDRYPGTITKIIDEVKGLIEVQEDRAVRTDKNGMSESQEYEYSRNEKGRKWTFRLTEDGWKEMFFNYATKRYNTQKSGYGLLVGRREKYHDFSF